MDLFVEACLSFIKTDSTPSVGTKALAQKAAQLCEQAGFRVVLFHEKYRGCDQTNLVAYLPEHPPDSTSLILQSHLDTADPGPFALWTRNGSNPFEPSLYQGRIYGLGAADAKVDFLCKLEAVKNLRGKKIRRPVVLVATYGEEIGMMGIKRLIKSGMVQGQYALVSEPTGLRPVRSGKGLAHLEVHLPYEEDEREFRESHDLAESTATQSKLFSGRSSHSSTGKNSDNAIRKLLDYTSQLPGNLALMEVEGGVNFNTVADSAFMELDFSPQLKFSMLQKLSRFRDKVESLERKFTEVADSSFDPPYATLNIGRIATTEEGVLLEGCVRTPPVVSEEIYLKWIKEFRQSCRDLKGHLKVLDYKRPFKTPENSLVLQACQEVLEAMGKPSTCSTQSATTEANVLSRHGVECVVFGPAQMENNLHTAHESVAVEELAAGKEFYTRVMERMCL